MIARVEILAAMAANFIPHLDTPEADAIADLLALYWPDDPPYPTRGLGEQLDELRPRLEVMIAGWDHVARKNSAPPAFREGARAIRFVMEQLS